MNEKEQTNSTDRKEDRTIVIVSVIGLLLSVISFFGYYFINHFFAVMAICFVDLIFSYFNAKLFFQSKDWDGARQLFIPLMMIVYWAIVFAIICIGNAILFEGSFVNEFFLYPIFLMPGFVFEILLLGLIASGL